MPTNLHNKIKPRRQTADAIQAEPVTTALLLTLLLLVVFNAYRNPPGLLALLDQSTAEATDNTQQLDKIFDKLTARGNVFLRFQGQSNLPAGNKDNLVFKYIRAVYESYPTRVYVADAASTVPQDFSGETLPSFSPTADWLVDHQIKTIGTGQILPDGSIRYLAAAVGKK